MTGDAAGFWSERLGMARAAVEKAMTDSPSFQNTLRNKLMKKGGPGYVQPGHDTFPPVEKLNALSVACGALPCAAWLDGLSPGEQAIEELMASADWQGYRRAPDCAGSQLEYRRSRSGRSVSS